VASRPAKDYASSLQIKLNRMELGYLRVRARGAVLTVESGPDDDPVPHVRFRRDTVHYWIVEMPLRGGRWDRTPYRGVLDDLVDLVAANFPWQLADLSG
jgi:hypothetical protein